MADRHPMQTKTVYDHAPLPCTREHLNAAAVEIAGMVGEWLEKRLSLLFKAEIQSRALPVLMFHGVTDIETAARWVEFESTAGGWMSVLNQEPPITWWKTELESARWWMAEVPVGWGRERYLIVLTTAEMPQKHEADEDGTLETGGRG